MITFPQLGQLGRLGNQLFQYAALKGLGLEKNYLVKIPRFDGVTWHGQSCLLENFNLEVDFFDSSDRIKGIYQEPDHMSLDKSFYTLPDNIGIHGFFQSIYYFENHQEQIKKELTPKEEFLSAGKERITKIKERYSGYDIVSLHLRRGDNVDGSNPSKELNGMYGVGGKFKQNSFYGTYLRAAKKVFENKKVKFLLFSGGTRAQGNSNMTDQEWCKVNFVGDEYIHTDDSTDTMLDYTSIMCCDHNVISHVSSFGWWAAYTNQNKNSMVVAPKYYHPDMPTLTYREKFYPEKWIIV